MSARATRPPAGRWWRWRISISTLRTATFVCVVGPSGCGKSTYLRILAGLDTLTSGTLEIRPGADPKKPLNSVVFQEYAVFPWKTVIENVAFGLQMRGIGKAERLAVAEGWLERVGLRKFAHYYPHQISGGMKQRVSIIRALANDPEVLLMDEPLGALDAQTRLVLQEELLRIWEETRKTVVYITHSLDEAILLGDKVVLMTAHPGRLLATFDIDIPRPRRVETMSTAGIRRASPRYLGPARQGSDARHGDAVMTAIPAPDLGKRSGRSPAALLWPVVILIIWNAAFYFSGFWRPLWWVCLIGDFVLVTVIAERIGRRVPAAWRRVYERTLAFGFPLIALIAWELLVGSASSTRPGSRRRARLSKPCGN